MATAVVRRRRTAKNMQGQVEAVLDDRVISVQGLRQRFCVVLPVVAGLRAPERILLTPASLGLSGACAAHAGFR
eukprot:CAMPEP_0170305544 /NCGR_PEP_ID=MMETSP0116_2-20130129/53143_1 /TAXON_ID=400756 /ORGANISM="Durinskia baltica, Strain CSIRO CS-38" /LENGTH=73 /DNA_ID=CAMNT_0010557589 /DNA_START=177 /DNA_END=395 /DNA_ORIENTATION=+